MDARDAGIEVVARERARRKIGERGQRLSDARLPYVLPLLSFEKRSKPFVAACAVKVTVSGRRFLFTAAHVIDALNERDLWYITSDLQWSNITGESRRTEPPAGLTREGDRIDAAVIELTDPSRSMMPGPFLGMHGMDINDVQAPRDKYLILGYPASRTKKDFVERKVTPRPLRYSGNSVDATSYASAGIAPNSHLGLEFDRENVLNEDGPTTASHPAGMSGCGVWRFESLMHPGRFEQDRLVAIFTEYSSAAALLVATRVSIHVEIVRHHWPELSRALPKSRRVSLNIKDDISTEPDRSA